ncbi:MAG TPA: DUF429 domain-containing protein, partial [Acidimicrobiales bacterium]|nr:DUF429 domain-containing protein [Acidimicrobiales bacterium]
MTAGPVLGVDGCRGGWVGIVLPADGGVHAVFGTTVGDVVAAATAVAGPPVAVGVDMPLHLSAAGWRPCDQAVRGHLGTRRSSVFPVPPAPAMAAPDYPTACDVCRGLTGKAFSKQLWMLRPKMVELDAWWTAAGGPATVGEAHPETSFSLLAGAAIAAPKRTWHGLVARRAALAGAGIVMPDDLGVAGRRA